LGAQRGDGGAVGGVELFDGGEADTGHRGALW
jgi:hypothetical protein